MTGRMAGDHDDPACPAAVSGHPECTCAPHGELNRAERVIVWLVAVPIVCGAPAGLVIAWAFGWIGRG